VNASAPGIFKGPANATTSGPPSSQGSGSDSSSHDLQDPVWPVVATEAVVVVSPLWNLGQQLSLLIDKHIQYYAALGFTR
jgi:hypothetical protein